MTAKDKQSILIKEYLKPTLKTHGYSTKVQTWWRDQGEFFIIINLQNFSWNTKEYVTFCFNIGIALKRAMKDPASKSPTHFDLNIPIREGAYLPDLRKTSVYRNNNRYLIDSKTSIEDFIREIKIDFEDYILPQLDALKTMADCVKYYEKYPFWGDHLKRIIAENP